MYNPIVDQEVFDSKFFVCPLYKVSRLLVYKTIPTNNDVKTIKTLST